MGRSPKPIKPPRARGRAAPAAEGAPPAARGSGRGRGRGRGAAEGGKAPTEVENVPKRVRKKKEEVVKEAVDDPWENYGADETAADDIDELAPNKVSEQLLSTSLSRAYARAGGQL